MLERRRGKRRRFTYYMRVVDDISLQLIGYLSDISVDGFRLDCQKELPLNRDYRLRLDLTSDVANKASMSFIARTKWCHQDRLDPLVYNVGFELIHISPADAEIFQRIYEKYGSPDEKKSLF
jgi:hypothetical protein